MNSLTLAAIWSVVWITILLIPPGSRSIETEYRINFLNGLVSSVASGFAIVNFIDINVATTSALSYFVVGLVNMILNDYYFKVKSYQSPSARKTEYFHHVLCFGAGFLGEINHHRFCTFDKNPFVLLLLAEISTPFLIVWRYSGSKIAGLMFVLTFVGFRIVYQGFFLVPECIRRCHIAVGLGFGGPYLVLNFYFLYQIILKIFRKEKSTAKKLQ
jgi:hypothetical protein